MKPHRLILTAALLALCSGPADAAQYDFDYNYTNAQGGKSPATVNLAPGSAILGIDPVSGKFRRYTPSEFNDLVGSLVIGPDGAQPYSDHLTALSDGTVEATAIKAGSAAATAIATAKAEAIAAAIQRANHTGTQAISTVSGLQPALDAKAPQTDVTALQSAFTGLTNGAHFNLQSSAPAIPDVGRSNVIYQSGSSNVLLAQWPDGSTATLATQSLPATWSTGDVSGVVAHWPLSEASGRRYDVQGGHTLSEVGGTTSRGAGKVGAAPAAFGTVGVRLEALDDGLNPGTSSFSVSVWVKTDKAALSGGGSRSFVSKGNLYRIFASNGGLLQASTHDGTTSVGGNTSSWTSNAWNHVVWTIDRTAGEGKFYVNGSQAGATQTSAASLISSLTTSTGFFVGEQNDNGSAPLYVDEVTFFNRAITSGEVATLYNAGAGRAFVPAATMAATETAVDEGATTTIHLVGTNTSWTAASPGDAAYPGSPVFTVTGATKRGQSITSTTAATVTIAVAAGATGNVVISYPGGPAVTVPIQPGVRDVTVDFAGMSGSLEGQTPSNGGVPVTGVGVWESYFDSSMTVGSSLAAWGGATHFGGPTYYYLTGIRCANAIPDEMEICLRRNASGSGDLPGLAMVAPAFNQQSSYWCYGVFNDTQLRWGTGGGGGTGGLTMPVTTPANGDLYRLKAVKASATTVRLYMASGSARDGSGYTEIASSPQTVNAGGWAFAGNYRPAIGVAANSAALSVSWFRVKWRPGAAPVPVTPDYGVLMIGDSNFCFSDDRTTTDRQKMNVPARACSIASSVTGRTIASINVGASGSTAVNWSVTGSSYGNILARGLAKAAKYNLAAVVINLGTNDAKTSGQTSAASYEAAIRSIISTIRTTYPSVPILLCKPSYLDVVTGWDASSQTRITDYGAKVATIAGDTAGVTAVDLFTAGSDGSWVSGGDGVHFSATQTGNAAAAGILAGAIVSVIQ